jgi:2-polyprenyl-3-methyl-5-hydroxy-6-metoxy-1,4-benzoquinol methylase
MSSNSITCKSVGRPARRAAFLFAAAGAAVVLLAVIVGWFVLLIAFLPFLVVSELCGWPSKRATGKSPTGSTGAPKLNKAQVQDNELIFDRRADVSKLFGCNTRNVEYRWELFSSRLKEIKNRGGKPRALDFGAGSLRDSFELAAEGFAVVSMDLDAAVMQKYFSSYDASAAASHPEMFTGSIAALQKKVGLDHFDLAISFDVIEHLENPGEYLQNIAQLLRDDGYLFAIVPNRRSVYERYFKYSLKKQREKGATWKPGVPHLQFKSPEEWDTYFQAHGFEIVEHDMAIGPLVNDCWHGAIALPLYAWVTPVLRVLHGKTNWPSDPSFFERAATPSWLMSRIDVFDRRLKTWLRSQYGWNLIVARRQKPAAALSQ